MSEEYRRTQGEPHPSSGPFFVGASIMRAPSIFCYFCCCSSVRLDGHRGPRSLGAQQEVCPISGTPIANATLFVPKQPSLRSTGVPGLGRRELLYPPTARLPVNNRCAELPSQKSARPTNRPTDRFCATAAGLPPGECRGKLCC